MLRRLTSEEIKEEAKKYEPEELADKIEQSSYPHKAYFQRCLAVKVSECKTGYDEFVRENVYKDYNPKNEFFSEALIQCKYKDPEALSQKYMQMKEDDQIKDLLSLAIYHFWDDYAKFLKGREEYVEKYLPVEEKIRRQTGLEQAKKNASKVREDMKVLADKWNTFLDNGRLVESLHIGLSFKMARLLKEDPSVYDLVPDRIKDNPASPLAEPLYKEWRFYEEKYPENIKDILLNEGDDYRKMGLIYLRSDAKRDKDLRDLDDPNRAKLERQKLRRRRKQINENKKIIETGER